MFFKKKKMMILWNKTKMSTVAFVALGLGSVVAPSDLFCDFSFPSYARFCEGTRPTRQKVFPYPTVRTPSALALSACGLDNWG